MIYFERNASMIIHQSSIITSNIKLEGTMIENRKSNSAEPQFSGDGRGWSDERKVETKET